MFPTHPERIFQRKNSFECAPELESFDNPRFPWQFRGFLREIRGKARDTDLTLQRTDADFFQVSRGAEWRRRLGRVIRLCHGIRGNSTETAQSAPSGVTTSSGDEPGRTFFSNGRSGHTRRVLSGLPKERILLNSRRSLNQRAWPRFRAVSVAVSVKIRGKARNSILNHRTVPTGEIRLIETAQRASNTTFPSKIVITHFASLIASVGTE